MSEDVKDKFIVSDSQYKGNINKLAEKTLKYGKITQGGDIIIEDDGLSRDEIVKLCLVIRFIAHEFDEQISSSVRPTELVKTLGERIESIGSRLSKLAKSGFADKVGHGRYVVYSYKIEPFLKALGEDAQVESSKASLSRKQPGRKAGRSKKNLTGVGVDIQALIDNGFFDTPKFMHEVNQELKKEVKFHDPKVVDVTVRKTFVKSRKSLKRIPNEDGGKAKWKYIKR